MTEPKMPLMALAPLHEVTDAAFRETVASCGMPDLMYTEFTSVDGLTHEKAQEKIVRRYLQRYPGEDRTVAQFFGSDPEKFRAAAAIARDLGFMGVDINMGCPASTVVRNGSGGALINEPALSLEIIAAVKEGADDIPVSVKTRLGVTTDIADTWIPALLSSGISLLAIHARTVKQMSKVPARWERIGAFAPLAKEKGVTLLGNGDVQSRADGIARVAATGCDGFMVGRAIFGNFWFFNEEIETQDVSIRERLKVLSDLAARYETRYTGMRQLQVLRKHVKGLINGFDGAAELRERLMSCTTATEFRAIASTHA